VATDLITASIVMNKGGYLCTLKEDFKELKDSGIKLFFVIKKINITLYIIDHECF
jgi:hypothetical protein